MPMTFDHFFDALFDEAVEGRPSEDRSNDSPPLEERVAAFLRAVYDHAGPFTDEKVNWARQAVLRRMAALQVDELKKHRLDRSDEQVQLFEPEPAESKVAGIGGKLREVVVSLIDVVIGSPVGRAQIGAAARHQSPVTAPAWSSSFLLAWRQDELEWLMEGRSRGDIGEVVLVCKDHLDIGPSFVEWKNTRTNVVENLPVARTEDGRLLVQIMLLKALRRAETIRDAVNKSERDASLPVVRFNQSGAP